MTLEDTKLNKRRRLSMDIQPNSNPGLAELPLAPNLDNFMAQPTSYRPREEYVKGTLHVEVRIQLKSIFTLLCLDDFLMLQFIPKPSYR
jgi:hypothetical protein